MFSDLIRVHFCAVIPEKELIYFYNKCNDL